MKRIFFIFLILSFAAPAALGQKNAARKTAAVFRVEEGFVDAGGVMIYYKTIGAGDPLVILHGGPGESHRAFLPHLLPLASANKLVFIDERGGGQSERLENPAGYTVEKMVEDVEAVRVALRLGKINLLGHSFGGALALGYALKYQNNLNKLLLYSTFHSTRRMNERLAQIKRDLKPELRERIETIERAGLFGRGKEYERGRYPSEYTALAWGEAYFPFVYARRPDPAYEPFTGGDFNWDLYREMWGERGEFEISGNMKSIEYARFLPQIKTPTLITVGDRDLCDPAISREMNAKIPNSKLVVFPKSGHQTFVDQPALFIETTEKFLRRN